MTRRPYRDEVMFFGLMEATAACIAFWFAREYRRGTVTTSLWWLAVCSLPWVTSGYLFSLARVVLTVVLLRSSSDQTPGMSTETEGHLPTEDAVDHASKLMSKAWQTLTRRNVLFTVFGVCGWCLAWGLPTIIGIGTLWFSPYSAGQPSLPHGLSTADMVFWGIAASVWLIGFVRVLLVLYRHLWKSPVLPDSDALIRARSEWKSSCRALAVSGAVTGSLVILMSYSIPPVTLLVPSNTLDEIPGPLNWFSFTTRICLVLSGGIVTGALLARPIFRNAGRWIGFLTSGMAMLIAPVNLVTFPSGLAAWILLTDPAVKNMFRPR